MGGGAFIVGINCEATEDARYGGSGVNFHCGLRSSTGTKNHHLARGMECTRMQYGLCGKKRVNDDSGYIQLHGFEYYLFRSQFGELLISIIQRSTVYQTLNSSVQFINGIRTKFGYGIMGIIGSVAR
jgi:hypothetical protein